mmetsp:Transcript_84237/g.136539  ORF Transcript_84237/g.136539 Transcript_84237/m.136539 type:complete len:82 (+) Transcript_84237:236-481(+)
MVTPQPYVWPHLGQACKPLGSSRGGSLDGAHQPRWWRAAVSWRAMRAQPDHGCTITSEVSQKVGLPSRTAAQVKMEAFTRP